MLRGFDFAAEVAAPFFERGGEGGFGLLLRFVRGGSEVVAIRGEKLFALRGDFGDEFFVARRIARRCAGRPVRMRREGARSFLRLAGRLRSAFRRRW